MPEASRAAIVRSEDSLSVVGELQIKKWSLEDAGWESDGKGW